MNYLPNHEHSILNQKKISNILMHCHKRAIFGPTLSPKPLTQGPWFSQFYSRNFHGQCFTQPYLKVEKMIFLRFNLSLLSKRLNPWPSGIRFHNKWMNIINITFGFPSTCVGVERNWNFYSFDSTLMGEPRS
jgi:hypothetical protein